MHTIYVLYAVRYKLFFKNIKPIIHLKEKKFLINIKPCTCHPPSRDTINH